MRSTSRLIVAALIGSVVFAASAHAALPIGAYTSKGAWSFVSAPKLHPPKLHTNGRVLRSRLARGNFLLDNFPNLGVSGPLTGQGGPLIVNNQLQPVWVNPVSTNVVSTDLQQESYHGKPVLLWWEGIITTTGAATRGRVVVVDQHYRKVATITAHSPWIISEHDAVISGDNIWVTVYRSVGNQDLTAYGGSTNGNVYDAGVQEYNLKTGALVYTWDALNPGGTPNVPLAASEQPVKPPTGPSGGWDAYHINAIQVLPHGQILVTMRNTWAVYLIDTKTNATVWTLGGKFSSFALGAGAQFSWEHDAQLHSAGRVTMFADNCCKLIGPLKFAPSEGQSRGLVLSLDTVRHTASLVAAYAHKSQLSVAFLGSTQLLQNGNALVGWGSKPFFSEYTRTGQQVLDVSFPGKDLSYRALQTSNWVGTPYFPPSGAVRQRHGKATVYASWDGATQVSAWRVLAGSSSKHLSSVAVRRRTGFETAIALGKTYNVFKVQALNGRHRVIGTSALFPTKRKSSGLPGFY